MDAVNERRISRIREEYELYSGIDTALSLAPGEMTHIHLPPIRNVLRMHKKTMECVETGEPILASAFNNPPEILTAMGVHWYFLFAQAFAGGFENAHIQEDLEALDRMPVPGDCCSLIRLGLRYLDAGLLPLPAAYLGVTEPCDGIIGVHEALRTHPEWRNVPSFGIDVPYWSDDFSLDYVAGEIKRMVEFVSKHTGKTLDINRLREVITESNEHYRLWQEYNDLRRCKPSPHNYLLPQSCFLMTNFEGAGCPEHTPWFRDLVADAERRVRQNQPEVWEKTSSRNSLTFPVTWKSAPTRPYDPSNPRRRSSSRSASINVIRGSLPPVLASYTPRTRTAFPSLTAGKSHVYPRIPSATTQKSKYESCCLWNDPSGIPGVTTSPGSADPARSTAAASSNG